MVSLFIVSKNRPCQLDLFLRSLIDNFLIPYDATILYTYTNNEYKIGYGIIIEIYKDRFNFVLETDFKSNLLKSLNRENKYFTSLGDDVVVIDKLELTNEFTIFNNDPSILALNYRMGPNVEIVFQGKGPEILPSFNKSNIWNWKIAKAKNWHYSMAMMGQFYRMSDVVDYLPSLKFSNPTTLETAMTQQVFNNRPNMICFDKSKIIEIAINRVQMVSTTNMFGNISAETLNEIWLSGKRIKIEPVYDLPKNINRFYNINLEYEGR